ncbi:NADPH oxidase 4 [Lamellibrachia satsuma]|nr:NADPH oxidase 4 [Lamellibrachia satsuma]
MMVSSAISTVRFSDYDLFWYNHRLFVVFYLLVLVHAFRGILREQTNLSSHTPGCAYANRTARRPDPEARSNGSSDWPCDTEPQFDSLGCSSWMWISGPLLLYICDTAYRSVTRQSDDACVVGVTQHPGDVIEVQLQKRGFSCTPGQFVLVLCPTISSLEWHPYTVTRCPDSSSSAFVLHIKTIGDWSRRLWNNLDEYEDIDYNGPLLPSRPPLRLYVDGPFGSPLEYVLRYRVSVCVAGGIGITPFMAHLHRLRHKKRPARLERIYLIWLCRDSASFLPFADLICDTHKEFWKGNHPDTFDVQLYVTSPQAPSEQTSLSTEHDLLCKRITYGRPKWGVTLSHIAASHPGTNIGIFCCGPKSLSDMIGDWSHRHSQRVHFYHESF